MKNNKQTIGQRIKELRESKGLTQSQLAELLSFSDKAISKWEKGGNEPDLKTLVEMSKIFNVTLDYLLTGETVLTETDSISKIELACREDNIALLDGVDVESFDDKGKNIEYYANKYGAKNVKNYLLNYKIDKYVEENKTCRKFHIVALPKDSDNEDDLTLIAWDGPYNKAASMCAEYEKKGYHHFKVFREIGVNEEIKQDYQYFFCHCLDFYGFDKIRFDVAILDDNKSGILRLNIFKDKTYKLNKHDENNILVPDYYPDSSIELEACSYVRPVVMKEFMDALAELDVFRWENRSWGYPVHDLFYVLKEAPKDDDLIYHKYYVSPGKNNYKKLIKAIQKICFESLKPNQYKTFIDVFNTDTEPYYRVTMPIRQSYRVFQDIDSEQKDIKSGHFDLVSDVSDNKE